ncbi:MAG: DUF1804 family protein [Magnetococcales bacterium]|nr:DUF1804 family protein [Magnetococcales bacterium]
MAYTPARRDLAFRVWREAGQNASEALRRLKSEHQWSLSRSTLLQWVEKYNWISRSAQAAVEEQRVADSKMAGSDRTLADLLRLKKQIDTYLKSLEEPDESGRVQKVDTATIGAYTRLCEAITKMQGDNGIRRRVARDVIEELIRFTRERSPQHLVALLDIVEPFGEELAIIWSDDDA